jgi:hypothetical protein
MKKYVSLLSLLIIFIAITVSFNKNAQIASEVQGVEAYTPIITIGDQEIGVTTQTICWTMDVCNGGVSGYNLDETMTTNYVVKSGETLKIKFIDKPLPNTINLKIEELPNYHEQWSYKQRDDLPLFNYFLMLRNKPSYIELPTEQGTYTYNMLVYWHGEKKTTQGMANYRFSITVE